MENDEPQAGDAPSQYRQLYNELAKRTAGPSSHPTYLIYFFVVMVVISPLNVWVELYTYFLTAIAPKAAVAKSVIETVPELSGDKIRTALLTFFPAVAAGTAMQLIWAANKEMRAFAILVFTCLAILTAMVTPSRIGNGTAIAVGILATLIALWLWWIANANQSDLLGDISPAAPIGGDDERKPLRGNLHGFITGN